MVRNYMQTEVEVVQQDETALEAAEKILSSGYASVPVVSEEGSVVGVVSEADLLRLALPEPYLMLPDVSFLPPDATFIDAHGRERLSTVPVRDFMHKAPLYTVRPDTPVAEAALLMLHHHIRRVPVVEDGKLVGIITRADILAAMVAATKQSEEQ
ncbi:MAG: CBS domain-containing protein [Armatimonadetes bacterium]|nr:CBS domain-containing protein [Armatimonadota bacterium]